MIYGFNSEKRGGGQKIRMSKQVNQRVLQWQKASRRSRYAFLRRGEKKSEFGGG